MASGDYIAGAYSGSQGVVIATTRGPMCLAGDLVMVLENLTDEIPVGLHTNVDAWYRSLAKVKQITDWVVPSHDMRGVL